MKAPLIFSAVSLFCLATIENPDPPNPPFLFIKIKNKRMAFLAPKKSKNFLFKDSLPKTCHYNGCFPVVYKNCLFRYIGWSLITAWSAIHNQIEEECIFRIDGKIRNFLDLEWHSLYLVIHRNHASYEKICRCYTKIVKNYKKNRLDYRN